MCCCNRNGDQRGFSDFMASWGNACVSNLCFVPAVPCCVVVYSWTCNSWSPCAGLSPTLRDIPIQYMLIEFTNAYVAYTSFFTDQQGRRLHAVAVGNSYG